jgi:hypothetical protein
MAISIVKASGQTENFDAGKLSNSLIRSGAPPDVANDIARTVEKKIRPFSKTKDIHKLALKLLREFDHVSEMRYSLKKALFSLGPSGYPFEKYIARVLSGYGYQVDVGRVVDGYCVKHEVDVIARKGKEHFFIECKYHTTPGAATDVKVALYVQSRFLDLKKAMELVPGNKRSHYEGWLVTNTRCTTDAIEYAGCAGLKIVSWKYPKESSLEQLIEDKRLYPVTILPSVRKAFLDILFRNDIVLAQDIADMNEDAFLSKSGLDSRAARVLKRQADKLCPCTS